MNKKLHELLDNIKMNLVYKDDIEKISLNLHIADRFYEIAPGVWEQFKKEIEEE